MERKEMLLLAVVVLLLVTGAIQTVQLVKLGNLPVAVSGGASSSVPVQTGHSSGSSGSSTSASLDSLPSMVGGC